MKAKLLIAGPSGAGKTWTGLSVARRLVGPDGTICVIDTEHGSALTYADQFDFHHLPWLPPFDPTELVETLIELNDAYDAIICDSLSHFWAGTGGTLDIAGGQFQGWKGARPKQNRLVDYLISLPVHGIWCTRSKMEYSMEKVGGKTTVERIGLAPVQDQDLVYEMNVAVQLDMDHNMTVTKSRTPAVPVGRMYPAGTQDKMANDYAEWLAGGVPMASQAAIDKIVEVVSGIEDKEARNDIKRRFKEEVGVPQSLTEDQLDVAAAWLLENVPRRDVETPEDATAAPGAADDVPDIPEWAYELANQGSRDDVIQELKQQDLDADGRSSEGTLRRRLAEFYAVNPDAFHPAEQPAEA